MIQDGWSSLTQTSKPWSWVCLLLPGPISDSRHPDRQVVAQAIRLGCSSKTSYLLGSWFVFELVTRSGGGTYSLLAGTGLEAGSPPSSFGLLLTVTLDVRVAVFCAGSTYRDPGASGIFGMGSACDAGMLPSFWG